MDMHRLEALNDYSWRIPRQGAMRVPAVIFASGALIEAMDDKVCEQASRVAALPGIVEAVYVMPDAHWGYGFPIGGVAAFDAEAGGVVSAGGVGFDISCGVRMLHTGLVADDILGVQPALADALFRDIPAGVGSHGVLRLGAKAMEAMLRGGARWAVEQGFGTPEDLPFIEEHGCLDGADPAAVSVQAKRRQRDEMGTLGSGNHYLEVQRVVQIFDNDLAQAFGVHLGDIKLSIHCGSRGLGHQIGTEFLRRMAVAAADFGIHLADRELACAPIAADLGQEYLGAMRAAGNCALANRQIITSLARETFARVLPKARLSLLFDVSHNTCKRETHSVDGRPRQLYVHRKGATRAFGPGHPSLPPVYRAAGQPVMIGGTMGTASYLLAGTVMGMARAFGSACHGAGRAMSRRQAARLWSGERLRDELAARGVLIRSPSWRGVAEEAPAAYKDVDAVAEAAERAGLAQRVARLQPMVCIKG
ncbi:RtcB family protein [Pseudomonas zhanjiangensis]|uniref:tRNA-splicing ligase RtcB n=1 Tax=Pseudomonas zhanjiangensis TaxID=3239015 RepID=A0ABV3YQ37_9PSED